MVAVTERYGGSSHGSGTYLEWQLSELRTEGHEVLNPPFLGVAIVHEPYGELKGEGGRRS